MSVPDAVIVGSGPNGLAAAVELGRAGARVLVVEQADRIGGGARTEEMTLPGFRHDVCSAIHPLGIASPFFNEIGLEVDWVQPEIPVVHLLAPDRGVPLFRDLAATAAHLGGDGPRYLGLFGPLLESANGILADVLGPVTLPSRPLGYARFGALATLPAATLAGVFRGEAARGLLAGLAAHSMTRLTSPVTAGVALLLGLVGHSHGWPMPRGGAQAITDALAARVRRQGGSIETGTMVTDVARLPPSRIVLLDLSPRQAVGVGGPRVERPRRWMARRPGPAVFKVDLALDGPIPWLDEWSPRAGTVHVGGTWEEVSAAEATVMSGGHPERPFLLVAQQSRFDPSRAPAGKETVWAYCHVPNGSDVDMSDRIESRIEEFAPGFKDRILARHVSGPKQIEQRNPNYAGGDIGVGRYGIRRALQMGRNRPYRMGPGLYLCSAATPPGPGVHGMSGYHAARAALVSLKIPLPGADI